MQISQNGLDFIKKKEAFRANPYYDSVGVATIGYGATKYPDGVKVRITDPAISEAYASEMLLDMIEQEYQKPVQKLVTSSINQNQFDALVSFTYNVGVGAFSQSTLLKKVNENPNDYEAIKYQFSRWNKGGGNVLQGLINRRNDEITLYFSGSSETKKKSLSIGTILSIVSILLFLKQYIK